MLLVSFYINSLETSENQTFSDVFSKYRKRPVVWNGIKTPGQKCCILQSCEKCYERLIEVVMNLAVLELLATKTFFRILLLRRFLRFLIILEFSSQWQKNHSAKFKKSLISHLWRSVLLQTMLFTQQRDLLANLLTLVPSSHTYINISSTVDWHWLARSKTKKHKTNWSMICVKLQLLVVNFFSPQSRWPPTLMHQMPKISLRLLPS